jgi:hypothetical protein
VTVAGAVKLWDIFRTGKWEGNLQVVAGVDLGGTAINYTLVNSQEQFLIEGLCEQPAF